MDIRQLQNLLAGIKNGPNELTPLTHISAPSSHKDPEPTGAECILEFVVREVVERVMSSCNAAVYNRPDSTLHNMLRVICL